MARKAKPPTARTVEALRHRREDATRKNITGRAAVGAGRIVTSMSSLLSFSARRTASYRNLAADGLRGAATFAESGPGRPNPTSTPRAASTLFFGRARRATP